MLCCALGEYVDCGNSTCQETTVSCRSGPCIFDCGSLSACQSSVIDCLDDQDCVIIAGGANSCRNSRINCPNNANCTFTGSAGDDSFRDSIINCGINGSCYFSYNNSSTYYNFHWFKILGARRSNRVEIKKYGSKNLNSLDNLLSSVYCPVGGNSNTCNIECGGPSDSCDNLNIYAANGFNDVNIVTTGENDQTFNQSRIFCGSPTEFHEYDANNYNYPNWCNIDPMNPNQCQIVETNISNYQRYRCDKYNGDNYNFSS